MTRHSERTPPGHHPDPFPIPIVFAFRPCIAIAVDALAADVVLLEWLGGLPFAHRQRIAFYGLSYGGKTAVRVPPLIEGYALSICSGDFQRMGLEDDERGRELQLYAHAGVRHAGVRLRKRGQLLRP